VSGQSFEKSQCTAQPQINGNTAAAKTIKITLAVEDMVSSEYYVRRIGRISASPGSLSMGRKKPF
jgi:hypothetical protein